MTHKPKTCQACRHSIRTIKGLVCNSTQSAAFADGSGICAFPRQGGGRSLEKLNKDRCTTLAIFCKVYQEPS